MAMDNEEIGRVKCCASAQTVRLRNCRFPQIVRTEVQNWTIKTVISIRTHSDSKMKCLSHRYHHHCKRARRQPRSSTAVLGQSVVSKHIGGLSEVITGRYDAVLLDQFGVLHDGRKVTCMDLSL